MRWIDVKELKPKMIIAKDVRMGELTLQSGMVLDKRIIEKIKASHLTWVPIKLKKISKNLMQRIEKCSLGDDLEVDSDVLNLTNLTPQVIESVKNKTKEFLSSIKIGSTIDHTEMVSLAVNYLERFLKNDDMLVYPLIAAKTYDAYTYSHLINVATLTAFMVHNMGLGDERTRNAYLGGLYHDIGKINIPDYIIKKPAKLSDKEFEIVKTHPQEGIKIISRFKKISDPDHDIENIVGYHHEKVNGTGYPKHFSSDKIPLISKIASIADVYDALTANRPYRKALHPYEAVRYILQKAGSEFDAKMVNLFIKFIGIYPIGSKVMLNTREIGAVIGVNLGKSIRPILKVNGKIVNLAQNTSLIITKPYFEEVQFKELKR